MRVLSVLCFLLFFGISLALAQETEEEWQVRWQTISDLEIEKERWKKEYEAWRATATLPETEAGWVARFNNGYYIDISYGEWIEEYLEWKDKEIGKIAAAGQADKFFNATGWLEQFNPSNGKGSACQGTFISKYHFLTAAHCLEPQENRDTITDYAYYVFSFPKTRTK